MKHPSWNEYSDEKKWLAIEHEIELDTHKGTTKDDLLNMMFFMRDQVRGVRLLEPMINQLTKENAKLKRIIQDAGGIKNEGKRSKDFKR